MVSEDAKNPDLIKQKVQFWIVCGSVLLLAGKFIAYGITNSVAILTDAMESIVNVLAGFISLYSLRLAARPTDGDHPYGHGKIEVVSASLEGLMILVAGGLIIFEAVKRLFMPMPIEKLDVGIIIVAAAGAVNFAMGSISIALGKKYDSIALVAGGRHLHSDTYSTVGLVLGLIILALTQISWIDSVLALVFGALIAITGISILRKTIANLTDEADDETLNRVLDAINKNLRDDWVDVHNLKIAKFGNHYHIDCDLTLPRFYNISQGHDAYELFKSALIKDFSDKAIFSIHFDPCKPKHCVHCKAQNCPLREAAFETPFKLTYSCMVGVEKHN